MAPSCSYTSTLHIIHTVTTALNKTIHIISCLSGSASSLTSCSFSAWCRQVTDVSIISISTHCIRLQSLNVVSCGQITDVSIISLSTYCTGLHSLNLERCCHITDVSIILISIYCTGLQSLNLQRVFLGVQRLLGYSLMA